MIFTLIPKAGYVGVGIVTGDPMPFAEATVDVDGRKGLLVLQPHSARATSVTCRYITDLAGDAGSGKSVTSTFSPGCSKVRL